MSVNALCTKWLQLTDEAVTVNQVENILGAIPHDIWVVAAVADRCVDNIDAQHALLNLGLKRTESATERSRRAMLSVSTPGDDEEGEGMPAMSEVELWHNSLVAHFSKHSDDELLCRMRVVLLKRLDKLETFGELSRHLATDTSARFIEPGDGWDDLDPWEGKHDENPPNNPTSYILPPLSTFLRGNLISSALLFASNIKFDALVILFERHGESLNPHRLRILQHIPEHIHPSEYLSILPAIDVSINSPMIPLSNPWRKTHDWVEEEPIRTILGDQGSDGSPPSSSAPSVPNIFQWYRDRISQIEDHGLVDIALALVQHGASQGVPDLDGLGEDLSLFSRLVYDAPGSVNEATEINWTLSRWKSLQPLEVVRAYLAHSSPSSVVDDIRRLVIPYLFVLESREERTGGMASNIVDRVFHTYLLQAPLELVTAIFDASKPTRPSSERLIKKDEDMVRLALAYLYGGDNLSDWSIMNQIFESLPQWNQVDEDEADEVDMTFSSLSDFVTPSTIRPQCTPTDLLIFFSSLTASALSRILDILDVHLESGQILARWGAPAPLRWFLQSANKAEQQRAWATRMSRRAGNGGQELENKDEWLELLRDMLKLVGSGQIPLRGAFGLLSKEEVAKIFFGGLLASGNFAVAKSVLRKSYIMYLSDPTIIEDQVLAASREFYDNATSGNLHKGDMKLAYECLTVAPPSSIIQQEKEFIEATSRICSFNVTSRPGIPISPIEIRLAKDRLNLIARVLSNTEDAYKHANLILDLMNKLGYRDDVTAEVKVLAMLADSALQSEDFGSAARTSERMIEIVRNLTESTSAADVSEKQREAIEVCWRSCFQLGRQSEFRDVDNKLRLLGHVLEICPPEHMFDVLTVWKKVEGDHIQVCQEKFASRGKNPQRSGTMRSSTAATLRARLQDLQLGSPRLSTPDAAALATRTLKSMAANFPFSVRGRHSEESEGPWDQGVHQGDLSTGQDVSTHAKQAFARGIGWLLGADDQ